MQTLGRAAITTSENQQFQQNRATAMALAWYDLTDAQRLAWNRTAALYTPPNRIGVRRPITGLNLFLKCNLTHPLITAPELTDPPPPIVRHVLQNVQTSWFATNTARVTWTIPAGAPASRTIIVYASRPVSDRPRAQYRCFRYITIGDAAAGTLTMTTEFTAALGQPAIGEYYGVRAQYWDEESIPPAPTFAQGVRTG